MGTPKNLKIDIDEDEPNSEALSSAETVIDEDTGANLADDIIDEDAKADSKLPKRARPNANGSVTLPLFERSRSPRAKKARSGSAFSPSWSSIALTALT